MEQLREDMMVYKLNLGNKHVNDKGNSSILEHELLKMSNQNKELKKEIVDIKHKLDD